jgi:hypothetical protein
MHRHRGGVCPIIDLVLAGERRAEAPGCLVTGVVERRRLLA